MLWKIYSFYLKPVLLLLVSWMIIRLIAVWLFMMVQLVSLKKLLQEMVAIS